MALCKIDLGNDSGEEETMQMNTKSPQTPDNIALGNFSNIDDIPSAHSKGRSSTEVKLFKKKILIYDKDGEEAP